MHLHYTHYNYLGAGYSYRHGECSDLEAECKDGSNSLIEDHV